MAEDHAGPLAGDWAGGSPKLDNLVSMFKGLNVGAYAALERNWSKVLKAVPPGTVSVDVRVVTDPATGRPTKFTIDEVVNGVPMSYTFEQ
ncbi:DNA/RNA non-specific endonuclease [Microbacterium sp. ZW T5_56]|uniref:DNA/RNA non-specific endonuclease n=1 Tax=Microbacterium sp. ZW T5_56 TaxID=3378081 RepID=UPI003853FD78